MSVVVVEVERALVAVAAGRDPQHGRPGRRQCAHFAEPHEQAATVTSRAGDEVAAGPVERVVDLVVGGRRA